MKNDIFNLRRFGRYFVSDIRGCIASYGLTLVLISMMGLITDLIFGSISFALDGDWIGADRGMRSMAFILSICILIINFPVKCYGKITDKKAGSSWLMVPVSTFEKFLSMIIITTVIVPVAVIGVYLLVDMLVCAADATCGKPLAEAISGLFHLLPNIGMTMELDMSNYPYIEEFAKQMSSPWLYIDDFIMVCLTFLLGAIFFKSGKSAKTFLAVIVCSTFTTMAVTPFMSKMFISLIEQAQAVESPENLNALFSTGIFRHAALIDTINDTLVNLVLLTGIFFRIKTLKH
jgi:hypothetical protein